MKYAVRPCNRDPWIGLNKFRNCSDFVGAALHKSGVKYETGIKTDEERKELEKELGFEEGTLKSNSKFWEDYIVPIDAQGLTLDSENPEDKLAIKVLSARWNFATSRAESKTKNIYDYVITSQEVESLEENKYYEKKRQCLSHFMEASVEEKRTLLNAFGVNTIGLTENSINNKLHQKVDSEYDKYLELINNEDLKYLSAVNEMTYFQVIDKQGAVYYYLGEQIAVGKEKLIEFLKDENKNSETIASMKADLQKKRKEVSK